MKESWKEKKTQHPARFKPMTSRLDGWCSDRFAITTNKLKDTWVWSWHQSSIVYSNLINPKSFDRNGTVTAKAYRAERNVEVGYTSLSLLPCYA